MPTRSLGFQSFYQAQLTAGISSTDLTIPVDVSPTPSEGILVLESTISAKREIIYYTSKTSTTVVCPAGAGNGRGYDGTTAVSHLQNATVIMAPVAQMFKSLQDGTSMSSTVTFDNVVATTLSVGGQTPTADWSQLASAPNTVTANGNRSYSLVFNTVDYTGTIQPGTRVRTTRTVTAPTQCTSLDGSTQYYSKTTPAGLSFTTTFTCSAWVKLSSYALGGIIARRNADTEGWSLNVNADGTIGLGALRIAGNNKSITSYQSIPLNKWVHVAATMDVSAGDTSAQKIWIDGVEAPRSYAINGTITALVQGTTALVVGAFKSAGTNPFSGKIAQAAVFSTQLSDANVKSYYSQGLAGTEANLVSAYSFNNAITDLNTTSANNLTASGSAVATNADSPYAQNASGTPGGTYDYGIIQSVSFSTNTTAVVQVPEGNTVPTSGGVSALYYSSSKAPYGMPTQKRKWTLVFLKFVSSVTTGTSGTWSYITGAPQLNLPIGEWFVGYSVTAAVKTTSAPAYMSLAVSLSTSTTAVTDSRFTRTAGSDTGTSSTTLSNYYPMAVANDINVSAATLYYLIYQPQTSGTLATNINGFTGSVAGGVGDNHYVYADCALL